MEVGQKVVYEGKDGTISRWAGHLAMLEIDGKLTGWINEDEFDTMPVDESEKEPLSIGGAIAMLSESDYSQSGKPKVKAIEKILGYDITAAERDAAWSAMGE